MQLISIIIPTYNRANLIDETLLSVKNQTYKNWQCIIVDDGSIDNTRLMVNEFIEQDNRFSYYSRPKRLPQGANSCRNYGLELSSGELICWLDSDDILGERHLEIHAALHKHDNLDASITRALIFADNLSNVLGLWSNIFPSGNLIDSLVSGEVAWQTASVVWERVALKEMPFNVTLQSSQEWTFHLEMVINDFRFIMDDAETVFVRRHENRIGKDLSPKKFISTFRSRFIILNILRQKKMLTIDRERKLMSNIFNALKKSSQFKYYKVIKLICFKLIILLPSSNFKMNILKAVFISTPTLVITGRGETLYKLS